MGYKHRRTDGPLTARQLNMLERLARGERQSEAAKNLSVSTSHVSAEVRVAATRMGASTSTQAVALYSRAMAYLEAARLLDADVPALMRGGDTVEQHVAHVLTALADTLRQRAAALLPS
jgi:DNA-binding CsgD family transcriptional regulator